MGVIPTDVTLFSSYNLFIVIVIVLTLPLFNRWMMPKEEDVVEIEPSLLIEEKIALPKAENHFASRSERSYILTILIGLIGVIYLIQHFITKGFVLNLNVVNTIFIVLGIIFHGTPQRFLAAAQDAIKTTTGIVFQFPFTPVLWG